VGNAPLTPNVSVSGPTALCPGESVVLTVADVCSGCTVQWSTSEIGESVTIATDGFYTATLRNTCGESPSSNAITVTTGTVPGASTLTSSGATALCPNESVVLTAENVCLGCIVQWSNGETGPSITVSSEGVYTATVSNICDESPVSNALTVTVGTLPSTPSIAASGSTMLCPNESVVLTADNLCPNCTVLWSNGETDPSITVSTEGLYTATLSNTCGESPASNSIPVTVSVSPATPTIVASGTTALCPGATVVLTADNPCPDCSVLWSNGEIGSSITVSLTGLYTAITSNACGESPISNAVNVTPEAVPAMATISASGPTAICPGESVVLIAENSCPNCTLNWSTGETGLSIIVSTEGSYTATQSNICGNGLASNAINVTVHPPFLPALQVSNLCDLAAPVGSDYQWFLNGVLIPDATGPFWSAEVAGNYVVTMKDPSGCLGTSEPVFAEACISSTFDVGGNVSARVYPNPAQDRVFLEIHLPQTTNAQLELYAADGRFVGRLFQGEILSGGQILDIKLPGLPAGVYQYRLATVMGNVNGNLVVQRL